MFAEVRAQLLINAMFGALVEQIQILLAQGGQKTVRIIKLPDFAVVFFHAQPVAEKPRSGRE